MKTECIVKLAIGAALIYWLMNRNKTTSNGGPIVVPINNNNS